MHNGDNKLWCLRPYLAAALALAVMHAGCGGDDAGGPSPGAGGGAADGAAGSTAQGGTGGYGGGAGEGGEDAGSDTGAADSGVPDSAPDAQSPVQSDHALTSGGAQLSSPNHELRLYVAPVRPIGVGHSPNYRLRLGPASTRRP